MELWDREEVIIRIKQLYRLNKDISYVGVLKRYPLLLFAAVHYFPNWGKAVTVSGIDYNRVRRQQVWSRKRIKEELMQYQKAKESLNYNDFARNHLKLVSAASYHFGSWGNAVRSIGINYQSLLGFTTWGREKIKRRIRSLYRKGEDISYSALEKKDGIALISAASHYFGNYGKAVIAGGLPYEEIRKKRVGCFSRQTF